MIVKVVYAIGGKLGKVEVGKDNCSSINVKDGCIYVYDNEETLILSVKAVEYEVYYEPAEIPSWLY